MKDYTNWGNEFLVRLAPISAGTTGSGNIFGVSVGNSSPGHYGKLLE